MPFPAALADKQETPSRRPGFHLLASLKPELPDAPDAPDASLPIEFERCRLILSPLPLALGAELQALLQAVTKNLPTLSPRPCLQSNTLAGANEYQCVWCACPLCSDAWLAGQTCCRLDARPHLCCHVADAQPAVVGRYPACRYQGQPRGLQALVERTTWTSSQVPSVIALICPPSSSKNFRCLAYAHCTRLQDGSHAGEGSRPSLAVRRRSATSSVSACNTAYSPASLLVDRRPCTTETHTQLLHSVGFHEAKGTFPIPCSQLKRTCIHSGVSSLYECRC